MMLRVFLVLLSSLLASSAPTAPPKESLRKLASKLREAYASTIHDVADALTGHKAAECTGDGEVRHCQPNSGCSHSAPPAT